MVKLLVSHPIGHLMGVCQPVVVVEDHDGGHHAGGHHEHDAVEVCTWSEQNKKSKYQQFNIFHVSNHVVWRN